MIDEKIVVNQEKKMRKSIKIKADDYYDQLNGYDEHPEKEPESWPLDDEILKVEAKVKARLEKLVFVPRDPHRGNRLHQREATIGPHAMSPFFFLKLLTREDYVDTMSLIWAAEQITDARLRYELRDRMMEIKTRNEPLFPGEAITGSLLKTPHPGHALNEKYLRRLVKRGGQLEKLYVDISRKMRDSVWKQRYSRAVDPNWKPREKSTKPFKPYTPRPMELRPGYQTT